MALLDILTFEGVAIENSFARGNVGVLTDMQGGRLSEFFIPALGVGQIFPAIGDVDNGITYGPTGSDYTGTLLQPAVTNVLVGVQYGAGGIEFTGTATGGGGGEHSNVF